MTEIMTREQFLREICIPKRKFNNKPQVQGDKRFASKLEQRKYNDLLLRERAGEVRKVEHQPKFTLKVNGRKVCRFTPDFSFWELIDDKWIWCIADAKGAITKKRDDAFKVRAKLFTAIYGPEVQIWDK